MGPQHDSCGRSDHVPRTRDKVRASMGPQHDSCGRAGSHVLVRRGASLQWGRNMIVAEGVVLGAMSWFGLLASMGPQHDSCGRLIGHLY